MPATFDELIASAHAYIPCQDDTDNAGVTVVNNDTGDLLGGDNTEDISVEGPTAWLPKAFALDGTSDRLQLEINAGNKASGSLSGWFYIPADLANNETPIGTRNNNNQGITIVAKGTGDLGYSWSNNAAEYNAVERADYPTGEWFHLGLSVRPTEVRWFVNGAQTLQVARSHPTTNHTAAVEIGGDPVVSGRNPAMRVAGVTMHFPAIQHEDFATLVAGPNTGAPRRIRRRRNLAKLA